MSAPLVSVVLPTHNRPAWLAEAVASVRLGAFDDYEILVSNNGDPQDTRRLSARIPDPRLRWVEQDQSLGMLDNFVGALRQARGTYVAVLHDDDTWAPDFLVTLVSALERHPDAVVAFADHHVVDQAGEVLVDETERNTERWGRARLSEGLHRPFFELAARQSIPITGCVFRRAALPVAPLTIEVESFYDVWISYLLAQTGGAAYYCPRRLMHYRAHATSHSTAGLLSTHLMAIRCRQLMLADPDMAAYRELITPRLASDHTSAGAVLLRRGERAQARRHLADALRLHPTLNAIGGWAASWLAPASLLARV